ncbi:MAG TPA: hypothetical protein VHL79_24150 [Ramlibacter sp.]|jgi:hypothetical protein|nr:hypothetical protein [Ramlibacter sp.]
MTRHFSLLVLLALCGCAGAPRTQLAASPCAAGEATYACQVERYHNISEP